MEEIPIDIQVSIPIIPVAMCMAYPTTGWHRVEEWKMSIPNGHLSNASDIDISISELEASDAGSFISPNQPTTMLILDGDPWRSKDFNKTKRISNNSEGGFGLVKMDDIDSSSTTKDEMSAEPAIDVMNEPQHHDNDATVHFQFPIRRLSLAQREHHMHRSVSSLQSADFERSDGGQSSDSQDRAPSGDDREYKALRSSSSQSREEMYKVPESHPQPPEKIKFLVDNCLAQSQHAASGSIRPRNVSSVSANTENNGKIASSESQMREECQQSLCQTRTESLESDSWPRCHETGKNVESGTNSDVDPLEPGDQSVTLDSECKSEALRTTDTTSAALHSEAYESTVEVDENRRSLSRKTSGVRAIDPAHESKLRQCERVLTPEEEPCLDRAALGEIETVPDPISPCSCPLSDARVNSSKDNAPATDTKVPPPALNEATKQLDQRRETSLRRMNRPCHTSIATEKRLVAASWHDSASTMAHANGLSANRTVNFHASTTDSETSNNSNQRSIRDRLSAYERRRNQMLSADAAIASEDKVQKKTPRVLGTEPPDDVDGIILVKPKKKKGRKKRGNKNKGRGRFFNRQ